MSVTKKSPSSDTAEILERPHRRRFTAEYKLRILAEADRAERGEIGALLRREGLYSSLLTQWRRQRDEGSLSALEPKKRGRKPEPGRKEKERVEQLERKVARLERELGQPHQIIDIQKEISEVLGVELSKIDPGGSNS